MAASSFATPQCAALHSTFLHGAPAPAHQATLCGVDTGVNLTPGTRQALVLREAVDGGYPEDNNDHGTSMVRLSPSSPMRALAAAVLALALSGLAGGPALAQAASTLAGAVALQRACAPPSATRASCQAQFLISAATRVPVRPQLRTPSAPRRTVPGPFSLAAPAAAPAAQPQSGTPAYLQQAYDLASISQSAGAGSTVGIVDAYHDPTAEADLAVYRSRFALPACTSANGCLKQVDQNGGGSYPTADSSWAVEISLDLDAVSALCPNCHIVLVEANSANLSDLLAAQARAAALGATQISDSWMVSASSSPGGTYTFPGVATVAAAGDGGYAGAGRNNYPAALPGVSAAGGTTLSSAGASGVSTPRGFTESAWSGAGSGCDATATKPAWQTDTGCQGRSYSDLSADADPRTGLLVYDSTADNGYQGWYTVGGTSESAPLIAAYYALTGVRGASPAWAYRHAGQLNDPVSGSAGTCAPAIGYICSARPGYDGPTGVGSISGAVSAGAPGVGGPGPNGSYLQSVALDSIGLQGGVYPNGLQSTYHWEYGTSSAYGQSTAAVDVGAGPAPVGATGTLSGLSAGAVYHYRLVAHNSAGTSYGYDFSASTASQRPTIASTQATVTGSASATLSASADSQGSSATYHFSYGPSGAYGQLTPTSPLGAGAPSAELTGLSASTVYHYSLTVTNAGGTVISADGTFTTAAAPGPGSSAESSSAGSSSGVGGSFGASGVFGAGGSSFGAGPAGAPRPQVSFGKLSSAHGTVTVSLRCAGVARCRARVQLRRVSGSRPLASLSVSVAAGKRGAVVHLRVKRGRARTMRVRALLFTLRAGKWAQTGSRTLTVSLR